MVRPIIRATALEIGCDAFAYLITLASLALSTLASALHYHQFGEPGAMAREAGLSAIFAGGLAFSIFSCVRSIRREMESGTLEMVLAHSVSRTGFFLSKLAGVFWAYLKFFAILACNSLILIRGAELGAAAAQGDIARMWGPSLACAVAIILAPLVLAAVANRFFSLRFVRTANILTLVVALAAVFYAIDFSLAGRFLACAALLLPPTAFFIALAGAAATRLGENGAAAFAFTSALVALPLLGNYYLPRVLAKGGSLDWTYLALAFVATLPAIFCAAYAGAKLMERVR